MARPRRAQTRTDGASSASAQVRAPSASPDLLLASAMSLAADPRELSPVIELKVSTAAWMFPSFALNLTFCARRLSSCSTSGEAGSRDDFAAGVTRDFLRGAVKGWLRLRFPKTTFDFFQAAAKDLSRAGHGLAFLLFLCQFPREI